MKKKAKSISSSSSSSSSSDSSDSDEVDKKKKKRRRKRKTSERKSKKPEKDLKIDKKSNSKSRNSEKHKKEIDSKKSSRNDPEVSVTSKSNKISSRQSSVASSSKSNKARLERVRSRSKSRTSPTQPDKSESGNEKLSTSKLSKKPMTSNSPIEILESGKLIFHMKFLIFVLESESSPDEATPLNPSLRSRLGPTKSNAIFIEEMERRMSPIEKFHQERSDQDITGRVINGRKIMVKTRVRTSPLVIISSGQNSPSTNPNSPQPMSNQNNASPNNPDRLQGGRPPLSERLGTTLSDRFSDSNRREDRYENALRIKY